MRLFFATLFFALFYMSGCSQGTAGLTIPAGQTFVLGEYRTTGYRASVNNTGSQQVAVVLIDRNTRAAVQRLEVGSGTSQSLKVTSEQVLHLVNAGSKAAKLKVSSPVTGNQGMGFLESAQRSTNTAKTKIELPAPGPVPSAPAGSAALNEIRTTKATLEPGQSLIIGEGSAGDFNVTLVNSGSGLDVSGRTKDNGRQTQGFGLGKFGKMEMYLRPNEVLYLVNNSGKRSTIKVKMDRPVRGVRIVEL